MHEHDSARVQRLFSNVVWRKSKSRCPDPNGLGTDNRNDVRGSEIEELVLGVRLVTVRGGSQVPMIAHG